MLRPPPKGCNKSMYSCEFINGAEKRKKLKRVISICNKLQTFLFNFFVKKFDNLPILNIFLSIAL